MPGKTSIEWTERSWNPTTGCTKVSPGCRNCYAEVMARRLQGMGVKGYENGFKLTLQPHRLDEPLNNARFTMYYVNSMSDIFHDDIPKGFLQNVFRVMEKACWHGFQVLTKRAERMAAYFETNRTPDNVWIGVTVENTRHGLPRIDKLRRIDATVRFLSIEPLLEDLGDINLSGIDWVIVGGESGAAARPMDPAWVERVLEQCRSYQVPFFFKQWGRWGSDGIRRSKKANGRILRGRVWNEIPDMHCSACRVA